MDEEAPPVASRPGRWDELTLRLHELREEADSPSYAEIAHRVTAGRLRRGVSPAAAKVARSSIFDTFRQGRTRINLSLVREIAAALDADDVHVDEWIRSCRSALPCAEESTVEDPDAQVAPEDRPSLTGGSVTARQAALLMAACVVVNLVGREFVDLLDVPLYADMVGTAVAAIALGPWRGALVGGTTNVVGMLGSGLVSAPFALVNIAGALLWGYGVRRWGMGRTLHHFLALSLVVAAACSVIAVALLLVLFGGSVGHGQDALSDRAAELTGYFSIGVLASNLVTSTADKLITGFVALVIVVSVLPVRFVRSLSGRLVQPVGVVPPDPLARAARSPGASSAG